MRQRRRRKRKKRRRQKRRRKIKQPDSLEGKVSGMALILPNTYNKEKAASVRKWLCAWIWNLLANMLARNLPLEVSNSEGLIPRLYVIGVELCEIITVGFLCYGWTSLVTILFLVM